MARNIQINLKVYSGLDKELGFSDYDPSKGLDLEVSHRSSIKKAMKNAGLKIKSHYRFFCN